MEDKKKNYRRNLLKILIQKSYWDSRMEGVRTDPEDVINALDKNLKSVGYTLYLLGPDGADGEELVGVLGADE